MSEVVDGRSADIHPHTLRIDRFEYFLHPCQGVVQNQRHASSLQFFFRASGTTTPSSAVTAGNGVPLPSRASVRARPISGSSALIFGPCARPRSEEHTPELQSLLRL